MGVSIKQVHDEYFFEAYKSYKTFYRKIMKMKELGLIKLKKEGGRAKGVRWEIEAGSTYEAATKFNDGMRRISTKL